MTRTQWYWVLGIGAVVLIGGLILLIVSCGSDDDDDGDETPTPEETETETTTATDSPTDEPTSVPDDTPTSGAAFDGTTGVTEEGNADSVVYVLEEVRIGEQEGYDRIVFEFAEPEEGATGPLPSYRIEYVVPPIAGCASGIDTDIEGVGMLSIKMRTAQAHNDQGQSTIEEDEIAAGLTTIVEAEQTCDFEGLVEWGVGTTAVLGYRVLELDGPPRLVVDILH